MGCILSSRSLENGSSLPKCSPMYHLFGDSFFLGFGRLRRRSIRFLRLGGSIGLFTLEFNGIEHSSTFELIRKPHAVGCQVNARLDRSVNHHEFGGRRLCLRRNKGGRALGSDKSRSRRCQEEQCKNNWVSHTIFRLLCCFIMKEVFVADAVVCCCFL